ncbi:MAG: nucleotidyltransferase domain-containing protein [Clostridia bacterium]|nr:nucleotidyltransferase domain-containing protein [Clostridia bacterium]
MIDIDIFIKNFIHCLDENFGDRVCFVGLQGSYGRNEATENSDIDIVVILDEFNTEDIALYNSILDSMPHREKLCGFISGKNEIMNWETADLFQFYHDTKPLKGSLDDFIPVINDEAVKRAVKSGVCNIYHGCVHNMLYEKSDEILKDLYKGASFVLQAVVYSRTGEYFSRQADLLPFLSDDEKKIPETFITLKNGGTVDFPKMSETLFNWAKKEIDKQ